MSSVAYPLGVPPTVDPMTPAKPYVAPTMPGNTPGPTQFLPKPGGVPPTLLAAAPDPAAAPISGAVLSNPHPGATANVPAQTLPKNPQLPTRPTTPDMDSQYQAEHASLANEISQRYNDVLKQLGYMDPDTGQFVTGRVESDAARQRAEQNRSLGLSTEKATNERQLEGTLFSGRRATEQARAEHPFVQALADLDITVPQQLSDLYETGGNLVSEYNVRDMALLAAASQRRAAMLAATAGATPNPPPTDDPNKKPPPPTKPPGGDPNAPVYDNPLIWGPNSGGLGYGVL